MTVLSIGSKAPLFTLKSKSKEGLIDVSLADQIGKKKIVLLFFPFAFTGVCTQEFCECSQGLRAYSKLNAIVYGISVDSPFAQEAWALQNKITVPLLSDFNKEASSSYGVLYENFIGFEGVAKRSAFVIDLNGIVVDLFISEDPKVIPNFEAIQVVLEQ